MRKRRVVISILLISSLFLLTGCGSSNKNTQPTPTPSLKTNPTPSPITSTNGYTTISGGLVVPYTVAPIPRITSGTAYNTFGDKDVNDAYKFAFSFAYDANNLPSIWEPNTKRNPTYIQYLKSEFSSLGQSFAPDLQQTYNLAIPNLVSPLDKTQSKLNQDSRSWTKLIMLPWRKSDGTLPYSSSPSDSTNYVLMSPWDLGVILGTPVALVDTLPNYGQTLLINFDYTVNYPFGDGKTVKQVLTSKRFLSFWIIPNPNKASSYRWLIAKWELGSNSNIVVYNYDSKVTGALPAPLPHQYP